MDKVRFTRKAVQDLRDIWNFTYENWSEEQADEYLNQIFDLCTTLVNYQELGKQYYAIYPDLRGQRINRHILYYRSLGDEGIEVVRILHEQMDLKSRLIEK